MTWFAQHRVNTEHSPVWVVVADHDARIFFCRSQREAETIVEALNGLADSPSHDSADGLIGNALFALRLHPGEERTPAVIAAVRCDLYRALRLLRAEQYALAAKP